MSGFDGLDHPTLGTQLFSIQYGDRTFSFGVRSCVGGSVLKANLLTTFPFSPHVVGLRAVKVLPRAALEPEKLCKGCRGSFPSLLSLNFPIS